MSSSLWNEKWWGKKSWEVQLTLDFSPKLLRVATNGNQIYKISYKSDYKSDKENLIKTLNMWQIRFRQGHNSGFQMQRKYI
jgi:hypothetical protein